MGNDSKLGSVGQRLSEDQKALALRIVDGMLPDRRRSDGKPDVATEATRADYLRGAMAALLAGGYVKDLTCIVRKEAPRRRWFDWWRGEPIMGESTVICGRSTVEQYLRCGYVFDWPATDAARSIPLTTQDQSS